MIADHDNHRQDWGNAVLASCYKRVTVPWGLGKSGLKFLYKSKSGQFVFEPLTRAPSKAKKQIHRNDWREADRPLVDEMRRDRESGRHRYLTRAAWNLVKRAAGGGIDQNKVRRLLLHYRQRYGPAR
jgi:hypothetical protein